MLQKLKLKQVNLQSLNNRQHRLEIKSIMLQSKEQGSFNELLHLSENLVHSLNDSNNDISEDELQLKVTEYTSKIENHFLALKSGHPSKHNLDELKQLMQIHEKVTVLFNQEKDKVSKKLKKLRAGKKMQNTYPDN